MPKAFVKQTDVLNTVYWLLLRKAQIDPTKRIKANLNAAIRCARNILRGKLGDPNFNLRREFVINSLSRDERFILPPTRGKGYTHVWLAKSLDSFAPADVRVSGMPVSFANLIDIVFKIEDNQMSPETRKEIEQFILAA